jgi:hypothetical protein
MFEYRVIRRLTYGDDLKETGRFFYVYVVDVVGTNALLAVFELRINQDDYKTCLVERALSKNKYAGHYADFYSSSDPIIPL